jgi:hypothetical protein
MAVLTIKELKKAALDVFRHSFGREYLQTIEYHARRTDADPKLWRVVEVTMLGGEVAETKELATDLKRNRAQALVRLLRSNQQHGS